MKRARARKLPRRSTGQDDVNLGKRIRLRRVEQQISQVELGDALGLSFQQIQKYEKGLNRISAVRLQKISAALKVPVAFFYKGDGKVREAESLLFPTARVSLRLLGAAEKIKDRALQRRLVSLMESIAAKQD